MDVDAMDRAVMARAQMQPALELPPPMALDRLLTEK